MVERFFDLSFRARDRSKDPVYGIPPWSPLVTPEDCSIIVRGDRACIGCHRPLDHEHRDRCSLYSDRHFRRHAWIARMHVLATHPLQLAEKAAIYARNRDALIEDIGLYDALDRDLYRRALPKERERADHIVRREAKFRHLNEGWDGKGVRPSDLASLHEVAMDSLLDDKPTPKSGPRPAFAWWNVLRVDPSASFTTIRDAYRRMARWAHPDAGGDRAHWDLLQRAYIAAQEARPV